MHTKLWARKVGVVQLWEFRDSQLGSPETKCHLGVSHVAKHKVYYKGEGGDFPQIRAVVSFVNLCLLMVHPCTKGVQITH